MQTTAIRILLSTKRALPKAAKTSWWLLKIILPISFFVSLLNYFGVIALIANYLAPTFAVVGLPGESAIVFISSLFLTLYAPIAILATLALDMREITILALMCLISHNLFVESAVQKKTGSSAIIMFTLRLLSSFLSAYVLNWLLPENMGANAYSEKAVIYTNLAQMSWAWIQSSGWLVMKITLIVSGLMLLQNLLKEFKIIDLLAKAFAPLMRIMGLSPQSSFLWFIAQIVGLTYGSAIMIEATQEGEIQPQDADLLNYHIAINHSLLEDTLLFVAIGVPVVWITFPRILLAISLVWLVKFIKVYVSLPHKVKKA
ncbi:MAG: hypothetical protein AUK44_00190 [Porphyromonadaceae bacterium CG2_30_38_12]|nr:MAG: hypothetical protein AUK44_00190 [Porphyromonadaceae bacterium CG2_30_38_12]